MHLLNLFFHGNGENEDVSQVHKLIQDIPKNVVDKRLENSWGIHQIHQIVEMSEGGVEGGLWWPSAPESTSTWMGNDSLDHWSEAGRMR